jgi:ABC-type multidrug transport system fused ATPase/permease subunit
LVDFRFSAQDRFSKNNLEKLDTNLRAYTNLYWVNRWGNIRVDTLGALMGAIAAFLALQYRDLSFGKVGFSLVNAAGLGQMILYLVRTLNDLEIELNSFERVIQYAENLPAEPVPIIRNKPSAAWPTKGDVQIKNLSVKYNVDGPTVLSDISFSIDSKERVGICGRTGSGKSTLCLALLRFAKKTSGSIVIDEKNIDDINLEDLRDKVTIIPQDAILFSGTIRSNLDPFMRLDDAELNMALRQSGLWDQENDSSSRNETTLSDDTYTEGMTTLKRKITLDSPVTNNGDNFSQGMVPLNRANNR